MSTPKLMKPAVSDEIATMLKAGQDVTIPGVGKLKVSTRAARVARNPATGASVNVPEKRVVTFTMSSTLKTGFAQG